MQANLLLHMSHSHRKIGFFLGKFILFQRLQYTDIDNNGVSAILHYNTIKGNFEVPGWSNVEMTFFFSEHITHPGSLIILCKSAEHDIKWLQSDIFEFIDLLVDEAE